MKASNGVLPSTRSERQVCKGEDRSGCVSRSKPESSVCDEASWMLYGLVLRPHLAELSCSLAFRASSVQLPLSSPTAFVARWPLRSSIVP